MAFPNAAARRTCCHQRAPALPLVVRPSRKHIEALAYRRSDGPSHALDEVPSTSAGRSPMFPSRRALARLPDVTPRPSLRAGLSAAIDSSFRSASRSKVIAGSNRRMRTANSSASVRRRTVDDARRVEAADDCNDVTIDRRRGPLIQPQLLQAVSMTQLKRRKSRNPNLTGLRNLYAYCPASSTVRCACRCVQRLRPARERRRCPASGAPSAHHVAGVNSAAGRTGSLNAATSRSAIVRWD